jgi:nucleotide-binding universal stress UspA family protein
MFKKILVPVDLSEKHESALRTSTELARQFFSDVILFHVIEVIAGLPIDEDKSFYSRLEKKAREHLENLKGTLANAKVSCKAEIRYGHRGAEIIKYVEKHKVDLIVLTTPQLERDHLATGLGSLSYKVGMFAQCPVLLIREARTVLP